MTDRPGLSAQYQVFNKALENLDNFTAQNPLLVASTPKIHAPSSSRMPPKASPAPYHSSLASNVTKFDPSRLHIPSSVYPRRQPPPQQSPTGHMRSVDSTPYLAPYNPVIYREPLEYITCEMVYDRIYLLLRDNLPEWWTKTHGALHHLTRRMTDDIIRRGQYGAFGPSGLASLTQIFVCIGHEHFYHYMCLAVQPSFGHVQVILRGESRVQDGNDPMTSCREGFDKRAAEVYKDIFTVARSRK